VKVFSLTSAIVDIFVVREANGDEPGVKQFDGHWEATTPQLFRKYYATVAPQQQPEFDTGALQLSQGNAPALSFWCNAMRSLFSHLSSGEER